MTTTMQTVYMITEADCCERIKAQDVPDVVYGVYGSFAAALLVMRALYNEAGYPDESSDEEPCTDKERDITWESDADAHTAELTMGDCCWTIRPYGVIG